MNARLPRLAPAALAGNQAADETADDLAQAFAQLMRDLHKQLGGAIADADTVARAAWHASRAASSGHSCIDVRDIAAAKAAADCADVVVPQLRASLTLDASAAGAWLAALAESPVVALAEDRNAQSTSPEAILKTFRPLVLDHGGLLYLYRYWDYERRLAARLLAFDCAAQVGSDGARAELLRQLFGEAPAALGERNDAPASSAHADQQRSAAATALTRRLCIISGGPGTGKTTTVVKFLAVALSLAPELRIALAAPTGKAAARMQESIRRQLADLRVADDVKCRLPSEAFTVHRLLGYRPGKVQFRHHRERPLNFDVVVVDEASMLDLALAAKLLDALPEHGRLILLGDKDQLASVETGAVFAEICAAREPNGASDTHAPEPLEASSKQTIDSPTRDHGLAGSVIRLTHSYRFSAAGGIGKLARCVNDGDAGAALAYLAASPAGLRWEEAVPKASALARTLIEGYQAYIDAIRDAIRGDAIRGDAAPAAVLAAFERYRVLCAVREGEQGAVELNACIGEHFRAVLAQDRRASEWFPGRPVLVTRNDYVVKVFNGDVGVALPAPGGELLVHFPTSDRDTRTVAPARLPDCETAFAMTIHKAQGSEFDDIDIVLPIRDNRGDNRLLTRELLYTALTRARSQVRLWAPAEVVKAAIERRTRRYSGLALRLGNRANPIRDGRVQ
ncbi:MAG: exodeoxyribonuclease V subunit alpha [Burkholderiales bacterium]|nr:exodeoxyribonuclease V subunit alpha [Burkholderiales bacterium]